jgi:RNA polymerase sigma factor (sigma-70 family)
VHREADMLPIAFNGLRHVTTCVTPDTTPDGELLARYMDHGDESAFRSLVCRHAGMVFGTCRRVLGNAADADDAFQAAFVVLVRKAHTLTDYPCLGAFLYGIAFNTALKLRALTVKRRFKEARAGRAEPSPDRTEVLAALDEELAHLPEKYRAPVVLCELEGRSRKAAAEALGIPEGTISSRLSTAHRMLRARLHSRGFPGVCVAAALAAPAEKVSAGTRMLSDAAMQAVLSPKKDVSQLATEITKMLLLHKIGLRAMVLAALLVGIATALPGSDRPEKATVAVPAVKVIPAAAPAAAAPVPAVKEPAWKQAFRKAYGLKDGELIRRVAPPYPECRAEYFKDRVREVYRRTKQDLPEAEANRDYSDHFTKFGWKDNWIVDQLIMHQVPVMSDEGATLGQVTHMTTGFGHTRTEGDADLLALKVTGDFVVRADAQPEKVAAALQTILRKECGLNLSLTVQEHERDVYVLSGKYEAKPLPNRKKHQIEVYAVKLMDQTTGGGGSGNLQEMADHLESFIEGRVAIGAVAGAPKEVEWHYNYTPSTEQERVQDAVAVMKNITAQTGLIAKLEKRKIKVLVVKQAK